VRREDDDGHQKLLQMAIGICFFTVDIR